MAEVIIAIMTLPLLCTYPAQMTPDGPTGLCSSLGGFAAGSDDVLAVPGWPVFFVLSVLNVVVVGIVLAQTRRRR